MTAAILSQRPAMWPDIAPPRIGAAEVVRLFTPGRRAAREPDIAPIPHL